VLEDVGVPEPLSVPVDDPVPVPDTVPLPVPVGEAVPVPEAELQLVREGVGVADGVIDEEAQRDSVEVGVGVFVGDDVPVEVTESVDVAVPEPVLDVVVVPDGVRVGEKLEDGDTVDVMLAVSPASRGTGDEVSDAVPDEVGVPLPVCVPEPVRVAVGEARGVPVPVSLFVGDALTEGVTGGVDDADAPRETDAVGETDTVDVGVSVDEFEMVAVGDGDCVAEDVIESELVPVIEPVPLGVGLAERDRVVDA
jgi:hypothetical protein